MSYRVIMPLPPVTSITSCDSKEKILQQIEVAHQAIIDFYKAIPEDQIDAEAKPDGWSVSRNMEHVVSTNRLMSRWIGAPRFLLSLFGKPRTPSPKIEDISVTNRPGIKDYGKYEKTPRVKPGRKEKLLQRIHISAGWLRDAVSKRSEEELDKYKSPFGGMSLRTFALFVAKHNLHHTGVVKARLDQTRFS